MTGRNSYHCVPQKSRLLSGAQGATSAHTQRSERNGKRLLSRAEDS